MNIKNRVIARLKEQSGFPESVKFVQHAARRILGDVDFDPDSTVSIQGGVPHLHVLMVDNPDLKSIKYFAKLVMEARHLSPKVVSVSPDSDRGKNVLKVEFSRS